MLCSALHCLCLAALHLWAVGSGQWNFCNVLPLCLRTVGTGAPAMHRRTAWRRSVEFLQYAASLGAVGRATPTFAQPHCSGAVGSRSPAMHCLTACGQWAVELLLCTATMSRGRGLWNPCNALPHCVGALGSGILVMQCLLPGGSGKRNSCIALPHCLWAVGSGAPALHRHPFYR